MKRVLFLIVLVAIITPLSNPLLSQSKADKQRGAVIAEKKKLVVLLEAKDSKYVAKLQKKKKGQQTVEDYLARIDEYNVAIEKAIKVLWDYSPEFTIIDAEDRASYVKKNKGKVSLLYLSTLSYSGDPTSITGATGKRETTNFQTMGAVIPRLCLTVPGIDRPLVQTPLPDGRIDAGVLGLAILDMQSWLGHWSKGNNVKAITNRSKGQEHLLKDYTLVIRETDLHPKLTAQQAKAGYPYPLKVVSQEEFEDIVLKRVPKHAVLYPFRHSASTRTTAGGFISKTAVSFAQYVFAPDTKKLLERGSPGIGLAGSTGKFDKVRKSHLSKYGKSASK